MEGNEFWLGKVCNIIVSFNGQILNYRARVMYSGSFHLTFIDKFKKIYSYNLANITEIEVLNEDLHEKEVKHEKIESEEGENDI